MKRVIKFRALRKDGKGWVYGSFIHNKIDCPCIIDEDANQYEVRLETVGQFTGLKDIDGTDVYEGDTLRAEPQSHTFDIEYTTEPIQNCGCCSSVYAYGYDFTDEGIVEECQIVGNIHEPQ